MPRVALNAHLLSHSLTYRGAGVSHYIHSLLKHLPNADAELDYVAFVGDGRISYPGWVCHTSPWATEAPIPRILWEQSVQPLACHRHKIDLLHVPVNVGPIIRTCPTVVTIHDLSFLLYPDLFRAYNRHYLTRMARYTVKEAEGIIAVSSHTRDDLVRLMDVPAERITVIPNGVDPEMRPLAQADIAAFRKAKDLPEQFILYLGTIEPRKNITALIGAFANLAERFPEHALVIAGGQGWYYEEIDQVVDQLKLGQRVHFPGFVPQGDLPLWYNAAELFVYPSRYEGFGLPPLEAMACGTPVITSDRSSLPEVVGDAGVCVDPDDIDGLTNAISRLLRDPDLCESYSQNGLRRASHFSWHETAVQTADLYHQILGGAR